MRHPSVLHLGCALLIGTLGCSGAPSIEEARVADLVVVDGVSLDGATLEAILLAAPANAGPSAETARLVVSAFIDAALFRKALMGAASLQDSVTLSQIIEPDAIRGMVRSQMIALARGYPVPTDAEVDSVTRLGQVRSFQAITFLAPTPEDTAAMTSMRTKVLGVRDELMQGGDFTSFVQRYSEDSTLIPNNGYLPAIQREQLPPTPDVAALWRLEYDQLGSPMVWPNSRIVMIPRRSRVEEARPIIRNWLIPVRAGELNQQWRDSVRAAHNVVLASDGVARMRELVHEPLNAGGETPLITWDGGELTPDQARLWVSVLTPAERAVLPGIADSALTILMNEVADRYLIRQVSGTGGALPPEAWEAMVPQFNQAYAALDSAYRPLLTGSDGNVAVRDFIRGVTSGATPYRPLPGAMVWVLRQNAEIAINQPAIDAILTAVGPAWAARRDSILATDSLNN